MTSRRIQDRDMILNDQGYEHWKRQTLQSDMYSRRILTSERSHHFQGADISIKSLIITTRNHAFEKRVSDLFISSCKDILVFVWLFSFTQNCTNVSEFTGLHSPHSTMCLLWVQGEQMIKDSAGGAKRRKDTHQNDRKHENCCVQIAECAVLHHVTNPVSVKSRWV